MLAAPAVGSLPLRAALLAALAGLCAWWLYGFLRRTFPTAGDFLEGAPLLLLGSSLGRPEAMLGLAFAGLSFRALFGRRRRVAAVALSYLLAIVALNVALPAVGDALPRGWAALRELPGFVVVAVGMHLLAGTLIRRDRVAAVGATTTRMGAALIAARDETSVSAAVIDGGLTLLAGHPSSGEAWVALCRGPADRMTVAHAGGRNASRLKGTVVDLRLLPPECLAPLLARSLVRPHPAPPAVQPPGLRFAVPLLVRVAQLDGALLVGGAAPLSAELRDALETLAIEAALALERAALAAELHASRSEARFRSLLQRSSDAIAVVDPDSTVRYITPSAERVLGRPPEALLAVPLTELIHPQDAPRAHAYLASAAGRPPAEAVEWRLLPPPAQVVGQPGQQNSSAGPAALGAWEDPTGWRTIEAVASSFVHDSDMGGIVLNLRDVTDRKRLEVQLRHQSLHCPLTGLPNRALFADRLAQALLRARRTGAAPAVLFVDLDNFKLVNDSYGHAAGDDVLVAVAERLRACLRGSDTAARLGGDEFAVLVEGPADRAAAVGLAERLIDALRTPFPAGSRVVSLGASVGVALSEGGAEEAGELLRNADVAMYRAKAQGRGRYAVFEPAMHAAVVHRLELEADLRRAVDLGELDVHYQPIVDLRSGQIVAVEALARWTHPHRGAVSPAEFVPLAEETGLIAPLGSLVLDRSLRQLAHWHERFPTPPGERRLALSVNVAVPQLQRDLFCEELDRLLRRAHTSPKDVILEVTETLLLRDSEANLRTLSRLRELGVRIALDDFGTGYSSLSYLHRLPVDALKIDRLFVQGIGQGTHEAALVRSVVALGQVLTLRTVAEGIETAEQAAHLLVLGCELGQGYYFARPLSAEGIDSLLAAGGPSRLLHPPSEPITSRTAPPAHPRAA